MLSCFIQEDAWKLSLLTYVSVNLGDHGKPSMVIASERPKVKCSKNAFDLFVETWNPDTLEHVEEFKMPLLNRSNVAPGIIVCHNHPSGNLNPS